MTEAHPDPKIELFVRSLSADETQPRLEQLIDRLESLDAAGHIATYEIHVWGDRVSRSPIVAQTDAGAFIRNRVIEFREWAADVGVSLPGGFESTSLHSAITGQTHEYITLPSVALAERNGDGRLRAVAPRADEDGVTTVSDHLDSLVGTVANRDTSNTDAAAQTVTEDGPLLGVSND